MGALDFEGLQEIVVHPVTKEKINLEDNDTFPLLGKLRSPLLFPEEILPYCTKQGLDYTKMLTTKRALEQYFAISYIKWIGGEQNSSENCNYYVKYLQDLKDLLYDSKGLFLDIGDGESQSLLSVLSQDISYIGIDPLYFQSNGKFKVFAIAEFLPFHNGTFDSVCIGTSLDHCFDPYAAINEASRVLKKSGGLYLVSLVWNSSADLYNDNVHFHHFRENQLYNILNENKFEVERSFKTTWKTDSHREVLFLKACKL